MIKERNVTVTESELAEMHNYCQDARMNVYRAYCYLKDMMEYIRHALLSSEQCSDVLSHKIGDLIPASTKACTRTREICPRNPLSRGVKTVSIDVSEIFKQALRAADRQYREFLAGKISESDIDGNFYYEKAKRAAAQKVNAKPSKSTKAARPAKKSANKSTKVVKKAKK